MRMGASVLWPVLVLLCWEAPREVAADEPARPVLAGYLPEYKLEGWSPERKTPLTDLIYFGIVPGEDGSAKVDAIPAATLEKLRKAKAVSGCRVLLCAGGWERSKGFRAMTASAAARKRFTAEAGEFCRKHGFDGLDFDWEHPEGAAEQAAYATLLKETHEAFAPEKRLVTIAIPAWVRLPKEAYEAVDRVHLMSYDQSFPQATLEKLKEDVARLRGDGCPASKIVAGVPFYGRNKAGDAKTYAELTRAGSAKGDLVDGYALNGPETLRRKVALVREERLAGVMVWEITQDVAASERSLLDVLQRAQQ